MKLIDVPTVALSIRQPWAWLIVNGFKHDENREWATSMRGPVLVHAGKTFDGDGYNWIRKAFPNLALPMKFDCGGYVGTARLHECLAPREWPAVGGSPFRDAMQFSHRLLDGKPIPLVRGNGRLGYFNVGDDIRRAIVEACNGA